MKEFFKTLRMIFIPSAEGMGVGCLIPLIVWGIIFISIMFFLIGKYA